MGEGMGIPILGVMVCKGSCAAVANDLGHTRDESGRRRWRQRHTVMAAVNGVRCGTCTVVSE
jgi:hypothetical protein